MSITTPLGTVEVGPSLFSDPVFYGAVAGVAAMVVLAVVWNIFRRALRRKYQVNAAMKKKVMLITVPKESAEKGDAGQREKSLQEIQEDIAVMETIFLSIGGLTAEKGMKAVVVGRDDSVSFEIVANKGQVSFYIVAPEQLKDFIEQQVHAQYPLAQIDEVSDYNIFSPKGEVAGTEFKFKREPYFHIKSYRHQETDPLNAITNAMSKVAKSDGAALQLVVRSARKGWRGPAIKLASEVQQGKSLKEVMGSRSLVGSIVKSVTEGSPTDEKKKEYKLSQKEEEMIKSIEEKASRLGLDATVRVLASADTKERADTYLSNIVGAFSQYNILQYGNAFEKRSVGLGRLVEDFVFRRFSGKSNMVMTGDELASIYHMPLPSTETPNINWLLARKAPPPPNLPKEGLLIGFVEYRDQKTDVYLKQEDRFRHMYMIGKSGTGKSETIANLAAQDIANGRGVCIVDPHGDLVETVLGTVPKERADDVIVFDPSDVERPVGLNMLEAPTPEMMDFAVGEMIAIFYKLFSADMIGPMFEHNMRNFMLTLMSDQESPGTIAEIPRLITDPEYQKTWVAKVKDPVVRSFWENEMAKTSDFHKSEMFGYLISKVGRFVENAMTRNIIGQTKSSFDFRKVMDEKKILLVNLSKGKIGDVNANLLGLIIVTKLQMAAMSRADITDKSKREDFFLYIDEFQNFITPSIATILSEARKYRLGLVIAHQYMGQLSPRGDTEIRDAVLGNVGTMMVGRIGIEDAEILAKEFEPVFSPFDLVNVEKFTYNSKILVDNQSLRPFNIAAYPPVESDPKIAEALKQLSRLKYGKDRALVEQDILNRTKLGI